ncbi:hypothetical protein L1987_45766 [Smallanthus sonchifolius]|uniref:Uncharacterized protein n=1 Tax=Smallanthus sonchifolius TaxID=185202 RepID=A0ACB9FYZ4_9ASTR|nr:hypothetical protein L1987_45766 [Smallanthus sonchifolius]
MVPDETSSETMDGQVEVASDSESTESDDDDPDAARISTTLNQRNKYASISSKRVKMKKLAAQGESSCRQDTLHVLNNDDEDPNKTQGGGEDQIDSSMPCTSRAGDSTTQGESSSGDVDGVKEKGKQVESDVVKDIETESDKLDCLIDLDNVFIDDWESDDENVEIKFEQDDEVVTYAMHEGLSLTLHSSIR